VFSAFWNTLVAGRDDTGKLAAPAAFADVVALLLEEVTGEYPALPNQPVQKRKLSLASLERRKSKEVYAQLKVAFQSAMKHRCFAVTQKGHLAAVPRGARSGDHVSVFVGSHIPFVTRGTPESRLIGECYVHGIMRGELIGGHKIEEIGLV
jgi:hypothetical protein